MRKKSHVSLAMFLVDYMDNQEMYNHRKAFCLGSILPDCKPSFLTTKHEFGCTYDMVKRKILELTVDCEILNRNERVYWRRMGEVMHYIADYFTFPHNTTYEGTLRDHCRYEKKLKEKLKYYICSGKAEQVPAEAVRFSDINQLFYFVEHRHRMYLMKKRNVEDDVRYIVELCSQVAIGMVQLLNQRIYLYAGVGQLKIA